MVACVWPLRPVRADLYPGWYVIAESLSGGLEPSGSNSLRAGGWSMVRRTRRGVGSRESYRGIGPYLNVIAECHVGTQWFVLVVAV